MADAKLEIVLSAKDASEAAFRQVTARLKDMSGAVFSLKGALAGLGVSIGIGALAKSVLDTASSFEQLTIKLDTVTKGKGHETLRLIDETVKDLPVDVAKATDAWVMMGAMGLTPTADKLRTLIDVSSVLGEETMPRVARALGQMASLGKVSAEELNQLSEVGINARKYLAEGFGMTVEQLQKSNISIQQVIDTIWRGLDADYNGGAKKAMNSWNGLMVQFRKSIQDLERQVADAGIFDALKEGMGFVNQALSEWIRNNETFLKQDLPKYIKEATQALREFMDLARMPSMTGMVFEGQKLIDKGLIDSQKFYYASHVERMRMIEEANNIAGTNQMVGTRGYKGVPGVSIPTRYRENLVGVYTKPVVDAEEAKKAAEKAMKEFLTSDTGRFSYGVWEDQYEQLEALRESLAKYRTEVKQFDMEAYKKASEDDVRRMEKEIPFLQKQGWDEQINDVVKSVETGFDSMIELSERTAEAMQDNFSDLFFDAMTGELSSFEDYATAVLRSIQRALADVAAQMATQAIFGAKSVGGTGGGGGLISYLSDLLAVSSTASSAYGNVFTRSGVERFASGGVVSRPTVFPFANGVGLMGEAGPEAVMPLRRMPSGRLGVEASTAQPNITINVAAPSGRVDRESLSQMQAALFATLSRSARRNA